MGTTKKHFERAAAFIKTHLVMADHSEEACEAAYRMAVDLFRSDNPRFDVERFRLACGLRVGNTTNHPSKTADWRHCSMCMGECQAPDVNDHRRYHQPTPGVAR